MNILFSSEIREFRKNHKAMLRSWNKFDSVKIWGILYYFYFIITMISLAQS
jgi:hypothetical protein